MYDIKKVEEHCYRIGVPVDVYFTILEEIYHKGAEENLKEHEEALSRLEQEIEGFED